MHITMNQMDAFSDFFGSDKVTPEATVQAMSEQEKVNPMESQEAKEMLREVVMSNVIQPTRQGMPFYSFHVFLENLGFDISHYIESIGSHGLAAGQNGGHSGIIAYHKSGLVLYTYAINDCLAEILLFGEVPVGAGTIRNWDSVRVNDVFAFCIDATNDLAQVLKELVNLPYLPVWTEPHPHLRFTNHFDRAIIAMDFVTSEFIIEDRLNKSDRRMKQIMSPNFTKDAEQKFVVTPDILSYSQLAEQPKQSATQPASETPKKNRFASIIGKK